MQQLQKKYLFLISLLTSSSSEIQLRYQKYIIILLLGLILVGFGVLAYKTEIFSSGDSVEVLNDTTESQKTTTEIVVEISGSVERSGVYKMKLGDRIDDLLIISGGLSINADRDWVTKNINRASKLNDGQKIYIYHSDELSDKSSGGIKLDQGVLGSNNQNLSKLVNINTASLQELMELPEIAQERGKKIIEHRPYSTLEELVTKGVISQNILNKIKNEIQL